MALNKKRPEWFGPFKSLTPPLEKTVIKPRINEGFTSRINKGFNVSKTTPSKESSQEKSFSHLYKKKLEIKKGQVSQPLTFKLTV